MDDNIKSDQDCRAVRGAKGERRKSDQHTHANKIKEELIFSSASVWQFDACVFLSAGSFTSAMWLNGHAHSWLKQPRENPDYPFE